MNYLLVAVNAKYIHSNLAVYDLAAYGRKHCKEKEAEIAIAEYTINHRIDDILKDIYLRKPDVVAFSCYIWNIEVIERLMVELKKVLPDVRIWAGGPEVSYRGAEFLSTHPQVDVLFCGEGEILFTQMVDEWEDAVRSAKELSLPRLLTCKEPMNLDEVPFVYEDVSAFENKIIYYESSRGCPFSCSYCLSSIDKKLRFRSLSLVLPELKHFLDAKVKQVKFVDRTFNTKKDHALAIWRYLLAHDNGITNFHFEIAADLLCEEEIEVLSRMRPGLVQLEIGVQSTNAETVREIHRTMDFQKVSDTVTRIKQAKNVHQHLDLIAGLPYEDYQTFAKSFCDVYALQPDQLQLGFLKVLSGSYMSEHTKDYGTVYQSYPPYEVLSTNWISYDEILKLKTVEEAVEIYYNTHQFESTMKVLLTEFPDAFAMYEKLGAFYQAQSSEQSVKHSRITRYQILLKFISGMETKISKNAYKELLILDLYLRENMKTRPAFAPDQKEYAGAFRAFYKREEEERKWLPGYESYPSRQLASMTHIEVFSTNLRLLIDRQVEEACTYVLLFDYKNRSAVSDNAKIMEVPIDEEGTGK